MNRPVTSQHLIEQWAPHTGHVRRQYPSGGGDSWSEETSAVARYVRQLRNLGLEDPTDATESFDLAVRLRKDAIDLVIPEEEESAAISSQLARGKITASEASKLFADISTPQDREQRTIRARQGVSNASRESYGLALKGIHNYGEEKWLGLLRPLAADAFARKDQPRWDQLQRLATLLRDPDLAALSMVATDQGIGREIKDTWRYMVGKPDEYHFWRLRHAELAQDVALEAVGDVVFVASEVIRGPHPAIAQMDPSWGPGIYSAAQVVAIAKEIAARQDAAPPFPPQSMQEGAPHGDHTEPQETRTSPDAAHTTREAGGDEAARQGDRGSPARSPRGARRAETPRGA